ncbi:MAG: ribosome assembly cofactor RimP [Chitinophagales bacterium]|nr:ribosome assembly cofactor RimP [Chitinophagales bacterium]
MTNLENRIREILEKVLKENNTYLIELKVHAGRLVQVFVDRDPHITIEECAYISRILGKELNEEFPFSEQYALEVSSPGIGEPFKVLRQYQKCLGREVEVLMLSGVKKTGTLLFADEDKIILEETIKLNKIASAIQIPFLDIKSTHIIIKF